MRSKATGGLDGGLVRQLRGTDCVFPVWAQALLLGGSNSKFGAVTLSGSVREARCGEVSAKFNAAGDATAHENVIARRAAARRSNPHRMDGIASGLRPLAMTQKGIALHPPFFHTSQLDCPKSNTNRAGAMETKDSYAFPLYHRVGQMARPVIASRYWIAIVLIVAFLLYLPSCFPASFRTTMVSVSTSPRRSTRSTTYRRKSCRMAP